MLYWNSFNLSSHQPHPENWKFDATQKCQNATRAAIDATSHRASLVDTAKTGLFEFATRIRDGKCNASCVRRFAFASPKWRDRRGTRAVDLCATSRRRDCVRWTRFSFRTGHSSNGTYYLYYSSIPILLLLLAPNLTIMTKMVLNIFSKCRSHLDTIERIIEIILNWIFN